MHIRRIFTFLSVASLGALVFAAPLHVRSEDDSLSVLERRMSYDLGMWMWSFLV